MYDRSNYRAYRGMYVMNGSYRFAPVRQGDARWDSDRRMLAPAYQRPGPNRTFYQQHQPAPSRPRQNSTYQQWQPSPSQRQFRPGQGGQGNGRNPGRGRQQQCGQQGEPTCPNNVPGQ